MNEVSPSELASSVDADAAAASVQRLHARRAFFMLVVVGERGGGGYRGAPKTNQTKARLAGSFIFGRRSATPASPLLAASLHAVGRHALR